MIFTQDQHASFIYFDFISNYSIKSLYRFGIAFRIHIIYASGINGTFASCFIWMRSTIIRSISILSDMRVDRCISVFATNDQQMIFVLGANCIKRQSVKRSVVVCCIIVIRFRQGRKKYHLCWHHKDHDFVRYCSCNVS